MFFINHIDFGQDSASIIEMEGHLDSESSPDFDEYVCKLLDNNVIYILIDLKNLNYISSEGIGAVLMIQKRISGKNGLAIFFNLNFEISSLFKLLGFDKVLTIASGRADALQILDKHIEFSPNKGELHEHNDFVSIEEKNFDNFVIECIKCNSLIRINDFGDHRCPFCDAQFTVTDEKKAVFKINEN